MSNNNAGNQKALTLNNNNPSISDFSLYTNNFYDTASYAISFAKNIISSAHYFAINEFPQISKTVINFAKNELQEVSVSAIITYTKNSAYNAHTLMKNEFPQTYKALGIGLIKVYAYPLVSLGSAGYVYYEGITNKQIYNYNTEVAQADYKLIANQVVHLAPFIISREITPILLTAAAEASDKFLGTEIIKIAESFVVTGLNNLLGSDFIYSTEIYAATEIFYAGYQASTYINGIAADAVKKEIAKAEIGKIVKTKVAEEITKTNIHEQVANIKTLIESIPGEVEEAITKADISGQIKQALAQPLAEASSQLTTETQQAIQQMLANKDTLKFQIQEALLRGVTDFKRSVSDSLLITYDIIGGKIKLAGHEIEAAKNNAIELIKSSSQSVIEQVSDTVSDLINSAATNAEESSEVLGATAELLS